MKGLRLAAVAAAAAAIGIAAFALPAGGGAPDESRGLTVTGTDSVPAVPDRAEWSFGVQTEGATAREALRRNAAETTHVIAALKEAGIAPADLRTEQVSLFPRTSDDGSRVAGYTASNSVHAVVRALTRVGPIVDAAADAGANQIFGPSLTVSDSEELYNQALEKAYDKALAKAQRLSQKSGVTLGRPLSIVEGGGLPVPLADQAQRAAGGDVATPIEPGTTEVQAVITVTFAIS